MHARQLWSRSRSGLDRLGILLDRHARLLLALFLLTVFIVCLGSAALNDLWYDEIVVVRTAQLPSYAAIWHFYAQGRDTVGPLSALVIHAALKLPFGPEIDGRLPSMLAFLVLLGCSFTFVHRRYPAAYAFAAMIPLVSKPVADLAWTAKGYMLEVAAISVAMLCWQAASEGRRRPWSLIGVWAGLAIAISAHFFAIFTVVAFAGAQGLRDFRRRRLDLPLWVALLTFPVVLLPTLHGTLVASHLYGHSFWSKPKPALVTAVYGDFLTYHPREILCVLFCVVLTVVLQRFDRGTADGLQAPRPGFTAPEWMFITLLAFLPCYTLLGSYVLGAYRDVYVVSFAIGFTILAIALVAEQAYQSRMIGALLTSLLFLVFFSPARSGLGVGARLLLRPYNVHQRLAASYAEKPWVKLLASSQLPVLAGDHLIDTQVDFYAAPELRRRLLYVTDFADIRDYQQSTTAQLNFLEFGSELGFQTMDLQPFLAAHSHFLLLLGTDQAMWLPYYLLHQREQGNASLDILGPNLADPPNVWDVYMLSSPAVQSTAPSQVNPQHPAIQLGGSPR